MTTALSVYGGSTASSTLASAAAMFSGTGGTGTTSGSAIGTAISFGQIYGLGNTGAWLAHSGAITDAACNPDGNGWLFDVTTLESQQIVAGNWTAEFNLRLSTIGKTLVGNLYCRAFKRSSGGTYTLIGTMSLTGQTLNDVGSALVLFSFPSTSMSAMNFATGDKLYVDLWFNCTTNGQATSALKILVQESVSTSQGLANAAQVDTPGYLPITSSIRDLAARLRLMSALSLNDLTTRFLLRGGTTNLLTLYGGGNASTGLPTAAGASTVVGSGSTQTASTLIGTNTGYGQLYGIGPNTFWAASGSIGSPDGNGWFVDGALLNGQNLVTGSIDANFNLRLVTQGKTLVGDLSCRLYKYNGGTYTLIGTMTLTGQTLTNVANAYTLYTFPATTIATTPFVSGDHLYYDLWFNCTTNGQALSTLKIIVQESASNTVGVAGAAEIDTPGYALPATFSVRDLATRLRLMSASQAKNVVGRFRLMSAKQTKDVAARLRLTTGASQSIRDLAARFLVRSATQLKDMAARFPLSVPQVKDVASRVRVMSAAQAKDVVTRFLLSSTGTAILKDIVGRLRLMSGGQPKDVTSRFRLRVVNQLKDVASRFLLARATRALTLNGSAVASSSLSSAASLLITTVSSGVGVVKSSGIGTVTGLGQITGLGQSTSWLAHVGSLTDSACNPDGQGWLWDVPDLEGREFVVGPWSATLKVRLTVSGKSLVGNLSFRFFRRSADGATYALIGTLTKTGITIDDIGQTLDLESFTPTTFARMSFSTGDRFYADLWFNCTTNGQGLAGLAILVQESGSSAVGLAGSCEIVTPGHQSIAVTSLAKYITTRFPLMSGPDTNDVWSRLCLSVLQNRDIVSRFLLKTGGTYLIRDIPTRFLVQSIPSPLDIIARLLLVSGNQVRDVMARFRMKSADHLRDIATRFILKTNTSRRDIPTRFILSFIAPPVYVYTSPAPPLSYSDSSVLPITQIVVSPSLTPYLVNGVPLDSQPVVQTSPRDIAGSVILPGSIFTLLFLLPSEQTQTALTPQRIVNLTFPTSHGIPATGVVQVTRSTLSTGGLLCVDFTVMRLTLIKHDNRSSFASFFHFIRESLHL